MNQEPELVRDIELLGAESVSALRKFLSMREITSVDIGRAKIAQDAFASYTRHRQSDSAREGNVILLARELAKDKDELRKFLKLGMPNAPIIKSLSEGKSPEQSLA